jgi:uncharacterized circularly permuted ATP-grasp superfamily protein
MKLADYTLDGFYDEMFEAPGKPRAGNALLADEIESLSGGELQRRQHAAELSLLQLGITFNVYGDKKGTERIWPFDVIPRVVNAAEWVQVELGLRQRIRALNLFIDDVYHEAAIVRDGIIPADIITSATSYRPVCKGLRPPGGVWCHITGTDLVRDGKGKFMVLEDNLRCPSGVSYVLENRRVMKTVFPQVFHDTRVRPVDDYPGQLLALLQGLSPHNKRPTVVVLTPGIYNSAYFEHSFLAQQMGVELVEGRDLVVKDGFVHMRTTAGRSRVDVIYRRIDDDLPRPAGLPPRLHARRAGLMEVYRAGRVAWCQRARHRRGRRQGRLRLRAGDDPVLPRRRRDAAQRAHLPLLARRGPEHVLENLGSLVVKAANESGGYGMLIGPHATRRSATSSPGASAPPRATTSPSPPSPSRACAGDRGRPLEGRHVDLRPYMLYGDEIFVLPGGLTRVALKKGSLVVNSSQGGGSKDTWVLATNRG